MDTRYPVGVQVPGSVAICLFLVLTPLSAGAQSGMSRTEAAQLYTAAGFPISNGRPVNRCGRPARPGVKFVDINADRRPEALFVDSDPACYPPSGRFFSVLVKEGATWRVVISGTGTIQAQATKTDGWMDMRVADSGCDQVHKYDGRKYAAATTCNGAAMAPAPQAETARPQKSTPPGPAAAQPSTRPAEHAPAASQAAAGKLQPADEAGAFRAAGFTQRGGKWRSSCDDPGTASYTPGGVDRVADLNGDGLPEAILTEGGTFCYGNTGQAYWVVSKLSNGGWKLMTSGTGIAQVLATTGTGGWPDISVGGPGFCFPVERWNGREYKLQRWEYEGKPCKPPR